MKPSSYTLTIKTSAGATFTQTAVAKCSHNVLTKLKKGDLPSMWESIEIRFTADHDYAPLPPPLLLLTRPTYTRSLGL